MLKQLRATLLPLAGVAAAVAFTSAARPQKGDVPTFNGVIAPILFAECVSCHRPGEIAPMSLITYENVRPWARDIKTKVLAHEMPPWPADPRYGRFRNRHSLTDAEVDALVSWVDAGAPQGEGDPPVPPMFVDGWSSEMNRPPDAVIEAPFDFELPPSGEVPAFSLWMKPPLNQDRFIEAVELRPTNRAAVHHASVLLAKLPPAEHLGKAAVWPGGPVLDGVPVLRNGAPAPPSANPESFGKPLVFYVPAGGFLRFPKGTAKRIQADDYLVWGFHFKTSGKVETAGARLGIWYSHDDIQHEALTWTVTDKLLVNGKDAPRDRSGRQSLPIIPANSAQYTVTGLMKVEEDLTIYALWPHMHNRGRDMTFTLIDPKGVEQILLDVPRYDFEWQFTYEFETPVHVRPGSTIKAVAHYDNSSANRRNPKPDQDVLWGPQSTNEMFGPFLEIVYDKRGLRDPVRPNCESVRPFELPGAGATLAGCR